MAARWEAVMDPIRVIASLNEKGAQPSDRQTGKGETAQTDRQGREEKAQGFKQKQQLPLLKCIAPNQQMTCLKTRSLDSNEH